MIFSDRKEAKRVMDGKVTAVLRPTTRGNIYEPYVKLTQEVQWRRKATNEDIPRLRDRQAAKPDVPVAVESLGTVEIVDQSRKQLAALTAADARALGVGSLVALRSWVRQRMGGWDPGREVWLVSFAVVRVVEEVPQFLGRPGPSGDYTTSRGMAIDDLECVDGPTQMRLADAARKADRLRAERKLAEYELGEELRRLEEDAAAGGVDISHHTRVIADRIARARRAIDDRAA